MMLDKAVVYIHVGDRYAVPLAVSIATLRRHCDAPVVIMTDVDSGYDSALKIAADSRLGHIYVMANWVAVKCAAKVAEDELAIYLLKVEISRCLTSEYSLMLDSDTVIMGDISELWPKQPGEVVLTHRYGGARQNLKVRKRCGKWSKIVPKLTRRMGRKVLPQPTPINTGVMAFGPDTMPFRDAWLNLASVNPIHSCDEQAAQLIAPDFNCRIADRIYNGCPRFDRDNPDVRIFHGVGKKFWIKPYGRAIWYPLFAEVASQNLGNILELLPSMAWAGKNAVKELEEMI